MYLVFVQMFSARLIDLLNSNRWGIVSLYVIERIIHLGYILHTNTHLILYYLFYPMHWFIQPETDRLRKREKKERRERENVLFCRINRIAFICRRLLAISFATETILGQDDWSLSNFLSIYDKIFQFVENVVIIYINFKRWSAFDSIFNYIVMSNVGESNWPN